MRPFCTGLSWLGAPGAAFSSFHHFSGSFPKPGSVAFSNIASLGEAILNHGSWPTLHRTYRCRKAQQPLFLGYFCIETSVALAGKKDSTQQ